MISRFPGRVIGIDLGERRIGVAVSDAGQVLATGLTMVERPRDKAVGDRRSEHAALVAEVADVEAVAVVVGLPLSLSGQIGAAAQSVLDEVEEIKAALVGAGLEATVTTHDERFTTVTAAANLRAGGRKSGSKRARADRRHVDQVAAAVMLQSWLDQQGSKR